MNLAPPLPKIVAELAASENRKFQAPVIRDTVLMRNIYRRSPRNGSTRREGSPHLSKFYRDRFGNQSPNAYNNLRLSSFDHKISNDEVKQILEDEFAKYKRFEVRLSIQFVP